MKPNQFIVPMDPYPYAKKHLHTLSFWIIICKDFRFKAVTLAIPWHNLDKSTTLICDSYECTSICQKQTLWFKTFHELLEFQGSHESDWLRQGYVSLTLIKLKDLINSLAIRVSMQMIMCMYMFNRACSMTIEFSKVLK